MLAGVALATLAACSAAGRPLVAEVFYDAIGDDTGLEFVELYNPDARAQPLAGARLQSGDGAGPDRWTTRWTGAEADTIPPHGRFVIGGGLVTPAPQAVVELGLQNGPDAVRLLWPDGAAEVVGYGALAYPEYFCGAPAPDASSGLSLSRIPDDADSGQNALDFRPAAPSPGRANQPERDLALVPGSLALAPEQPPDGAPAALSGVLFNRGAEPVQADEASILAGWSDLAPFQLPVRSGLAPGDTLAWRAEISGLPSGKQWLRARVVYPGDESSGNDADSILVRVGPGPLEVTEIQFHPGAGEGEWVEVRSGVAGLDLAGFTLSDRTRVRGSPAGGAGPIEAESLAVLAQDRPALLARYPGLDPLRVWQVTPWPSLNNTDDSTGVADAVILRDMDGVRSDRVDYSARGVPAGFPIERSASGAWGPALDPGGTPLAPPRSPPAPAARFELRPRRLAAGSTLHLAWSLPWPEASVAVDLYDLAGRRVGEAVPLTASAGTGERSWSAAGLLPGVYVAALTASRSGELLVETRALRIEGTAP